MLYRSSIRAAAALLIGFLPVPAWAEADPNKTERSDASPADSASTEDASPATRIVRSLDDDGLRAYLAEVLERNPDLAARHARIRALAELPAQAAALPDPMLQASLFALPPETRVGPQRLQVGVQQRLPDGRRRQLRSDDAELTADAAEAELRAAELTKITEGRELWLELAFAQRLEGILRQERHHLERHEEAARARYAAGTGLAQGPIKIQAELTRIDAEILAVESRRHSLLARLDALRDRFGAPLAPAHLPDVDAAVDRLVRSPGDAEDLEVVVAVALARRPEVQAAARQQDRARVGEDLAERNRRPDFTVGVAWTLVEPRDDAAGRANPPEDDGRDVLALTGGMTLPLWRAPREAELREALARTSAADAEQRRVAADVRRQVTDLLHRLPLDHRQLTLLRDVLERQAEEAVSSAVAAYAAGRNNALDLLDAEHRLFEVRRAVARAHADVAIALARLEGGVAGPLGSLHHPGPSPTNAANGPEGQRGQEP